MKASHLFFEKKRCGQKNLRRGLCCVHSPLSLLKFLFFRRFFSLSKEKKRQNNHNCLKIYAFTLSSFEYFQAPSSAVLEKGTITWKSMWVPS